MAKVLFIGDINVDVMMGGMSSLPVVDREVTATTYDVVMGASTVICACAYASLGGDTSMMGLAGNDAYGDFMVQGLHSFGIDTRLVRRTDRVKTGVTVNLIHENTRTQVTYPGTIAEFDGRDVDAGALAGFDHIHFGGVYLQAKLLPEITRILRSARQAGISTSIDPQWDGSERWQGMVDWLPLLTYLFVNSDEAHSITKTADSGEAIRALAAKTRFPVVKTGSEGALLWIDGAVKAVPAIPVQVVDTTGAGDSFDAGFLYATLEKGMSPMEAAEFAVAVAARSCTFVGGVNARSSYADVTAFKAYSASR